MINHARALAASSACLMTTSAMAAFQRTDCESGQRKLLSAFATESILDRKNAVTFLPHFGCPIPC